MIINKKNNKGFTLAEILVTMSIFVVIFAMAVTGLRKGERNSQLVLATEGVSSDIRKIQTQSLAGIIEQEIDDPLGGFGVYFSTEAENNDKYILFRDNGDQIYNTEEDNLLEEISLPNNITISGLSIEEDNLSLVFKPPKSEIYVNAEQVIDTSLEIYVVSSLVDNKQGKISINTITGRVISELEDYE